MKKKLCLITQSTGNGSYKILHERTEDVVGAVFDISVFEQNDTDSIDIARFDILFLNKVTHIDAIKVVIKAKNNNIPVLYESDDNFFTEDVYDGCLVHNMHVEKKVFLEKIVSFADLVIVYSREAYLSFHRYNKSVVVFPTYQILYGNDAPKADAGAGRVVGFMGSGMKDVNFPFVMPALELLQNKYADVRFEFLGFVPQGTEKLNVTFSSGEYIDYQRFISMFKDRHWAVGLAPLADTGFNRSKTNNKYREYAAAGYAGVYSNIEPYSNTVVDGQTGLLADNTAESWFSALDRLLADDGLRHAIARNAWQDMAENYQFSRYCQVKMLALTSLAERHDRHAIASLVARTQAKNKQIIL